MRNWFKQLSNQTKYRLFRALYGATFLLVSLCLGGVMSNGGFGATNPFRLKLWLVLLIVCLIFGLPCALAYYYYKGRRKDVEIGLAETEALAHAGEMMIDEDKSKRQPPTDKMVQ